MSLERARAHLERFGFADRIILFEQSSATVALAAQALGVEPGRIAKSLSFSVKGRCVVILARGDARIDNQAFKAFFGTKAQMLPAELAEELLGHAVGGVCPFGLNEGVEVYLDRSLCDFDVVYPAAGTSSSAVRLTVEELERCSESLGYVSVTKLV